MYHHHSILYFVWKLLGCVLSGTIDVLGEILFENKNKICFCLLSLISIICTNVMLQSNSFNFLCPAESNISKNFEGFAQFVFVVKLDPIIACLGSHFIFLSVMVLWYHSQPKRASEGTAFWVRSVYEFLEFINKIRVKPRLGYERYPVCRFWFHMFAFLNPQSFLFWTFFIIIWNSTIYLLESIDSHFQWRIHCLDFLCFYH